MVLSCPATWEDEATRWEKHTPEREVSPNGFQGSHPAVTEARPLPFFAMGLCQPTTSPFFIGRPELGFGHLKRKGPKPNTQDAELVRRWLWVQPIFLVLSNVFCLLILLFAF